MPGTRNIFRVPSDADLPLLSSNAGSDAPAVLERLLEDLLDAAGANCIPAPAIALTAPLSSMPLLHSRRRARASTWRQALALRTISGPTARPFLAALSARRSPRRRGTDAPSRGSWLSMQPNCALLYYIARTCHRSACTAPSAPFPTSAAPTSSSSPAKAGQTGARKRSLALPFPYSTQRFVPVRSELDRDVLSALEHLQVSLDVHGTECALQRIRPRNNTPNTQLMVSVTLAGGSARHYCLVIDADRRRKRPPR